MCKIGPIIYLDVNSDDIPDSDSELWNLSGFNFNSTWLLLFFCSTSCSDSPLWLTGKDVDAHKVAL